MSALDRCANYADDRQLARRRLPRVLFDYIDGGSYTETTLRKNVEALADEAIEQRVARDMSSPKIAATLFGQSIAMPLILGPVGFVGMYARRGEVQAARAAHAAGVPFCLSTVGIVSIKELASTDLPFWFQLYIMRDRGATFDLLARARAAGCTTLVVTVDLPTPGVRYRDIRSGMSARPDTLAWLQMLRDVAAHPRWLYDVQLRGRPHSFGSLASVAPINRGFAEAWAWIRDNFDPTVSWDDLARVRAAWPGTLIIKGILHPDDAREAASLGADGIVVSNHGGRQLDGAMAAITALRPIVAAVGDTTTVLVDGGVRSGLDILKMRKAGATAILVGRAWAMALAAGGESGVSRMLRRVREEYRAGLVLSGTA